MISPLLAKIYLHYVLDEWFEEVVKPRLRGEAYEIRYADDFILCFEYQEDAERVLKALTKRFAKYGLTLHPEKTRLIEFGREALTKSEMGKGKKPATFDFLGFTLAWSTRAARRLQRLVGQHAWNAMLEGTLPPLSSRDPRWSGASKSRFTGSTGRFQNILRS